MIHPNDRFERNPDVLHRRMKEESILLPIQQKKATSRRFYSFKEVGERIWGLLDGNRECRKIIETVALEFGVKKERIGKEVFAFIKDLEKEGLIRRLP